MKGISEERSNALYGEHQTQMKSNLILMLLNRCKKLNVWKPINMNTPKDRHILLLSEDDVAVEGYFTALDGGCWVDGINYKAIKPKFWQELPPLPKEKL